MKASTTPLSRTGSLNHPPRPLARKEGRAKEQGNPLALGPPAGKKTKFLSLADVPPRPSGAPSDSRSIILLNGDDATSTLNKSRSGVVALTRSAHVVSKEPLSRRRVRTEALKSMPVLLPFGQSEGDRSQTTFDAAFKLREETEDEPAVKVSTLCTTQKLCCPRSSSLTPSPPRSLPRGLSERPARQTIFLSRRLRPSSPSRLSHRLRLPYQLPDSRPPQRPQDAAERVATSPCEAHP